MPVTSVKTGISQMKKIRGEIWCKMPVTTEVSGISLEISPYYPAIVSDGEISSDMLVLTKETGISQEIWLSNFSRNRWYKHALDRFKRIISVKVLR